MQFVVRGKTPDHLDRSIRIEAESAPQAEAIGWARGIFVTEVITMEEQTRRRSRAIQTLLANTWRWIAPRSTSVFGRTVTGAQSIGFLAAGTATWVLDLRVFHFV